MIKIVSYVMRRQLSLMEHSRALSLYAVADDNMDRLLQETIVNIIANKLRNVRLRVSDRLIKFLNSDARNSARKLA
jgi:hypothetical protein